MFNGTKTHLSPVWAGVLQQTWPSAPSTRSETCPPPGSPWTCWREAELHQLSSSIRRDLMEVMDSPWDAVVGQRNHPILCRNTESKVLYLQSSTKPFWSPRTITDLRVSLQVHQFGDGRAVNVRVQQTDWPGLRQEGFCQLGAETSELLHDWRPGPVQRRNTPVVYVLFKHQNVQLSLRL